MLKKKEKKKKFPFSFPLPAICSTWAILSYSNARDSLGFFGIP